MADPTGNEEAQIEKAAELGQITEEKKEELLGGLNVGVGKEEDAGPKDGEEVPPIAATVTQEEIQIGDRTFTNEADAIVYAKELEAGRVANDSYRQGVQDTLGQPQGNLPTVPAVKPNSEEVNDKFYNDPQKFISEAVQQAADDGYQRAIDEVNHGKKQDAIWVEFYTQNPELKSKDKLVRSILNDNWELLGQMPDHRSAMKILAKKTHDQLKEWIGEQAPTEVLSNDPISVSPGSQSQVTSKKIEEKPLDFVSQLRKHQSNRMA